jgi:hypothetical protein
VNNEANLVALPDDSQALKAMLAALMNEHDKQTQLAEEQSKLAEEQSKLAEEQTKRANDLHVENLRLQLELDRYRKWYYGPRADRLQSSGDLAQMLLNFAEEMDLKPVNPDDLPQRTSGRASAREAAQGTAQSC